jgi:hypothetical protein
VIYNSLDEIFETKARALEMIKQQTGSLTPSQATLRPSNGGWTVAEIVEHLCIVEGQVLPLIASLVRKAEESGSIPPRTPLEIQVDSFLERARKEKYVTRPKFAATGKAGLVDSLAVLQDLQKQFFDLKPRLKSIDLASVSFPHYIFGPFTLGQWLVFIGYHEERHLDQMKAILGSAEFKSLPNT